MTKVHLSRLVLMTVLFVVVHSLVKAQPSSPLPLLIDGEVEKALKLGMPELQKLKQTEVTAKDHSGKPRLYNGVALFDILKEAGVTLGSQLRGKNLLKYVTVMDMRLFFLFPRSILNSPTNLFLSPTVKTVNRCRKAMDRSESLCQMTRNTHAGSGRSPL
jgi:hypothetical protein